MLLNTLPVLAGAAILYWPCAASDGWGAISIALFQFQLMGYHGAFLNRAILF